MHWKRRKSSTWWEEVHPKIGASFWLPLGSYTGMLSPLLWTTPKSGMHPWEEPSPSGVGEKPEPTRDFNVVVDLPD